MSRRFTLDFLRNETASGAALGVAAVLAIVVANSPWAPAYFGWLKSVQPLQAGPLRLDLSVSQWIKDGLMAVFFLVVGLEIKHEILRGELSDPRKLATPVIAALGGMVGPALVYLLLGSLTGAPHRGWPIPLATDIAFALAVFALVGRGLPSSLRIFLLTLAIVDDLGAILLIGLLFSDGVQAAPALAALGLIAATALVGHRFRITAPLWAASFAGVWLLTQASGLSTSLGAVAFAAAVPVKPRDEDGQSPLTEAMADLHPYNAFLVLPLFAFAKAGVSFQGLDPAQALSPLVLCIAAGLFLGKQAGVLGAAWFAAASGLGARPTGATWPQLYGVALLCGIGFTMSLFIGGLAFPGDVDSPLQIQVKLGVLCGSALSALAAAAVLALASKTGDAERLGGADPG